MISRASLSPERTFLVLATLAAFAGALNGPFHFDDFFLLHDPSILSSSGWTAVFQLATTRPLSWLSYWLNYQASGTAPFTWHALGLLMHTASVLVLYHCLRRIAPPWPALLGAGVFALHPLQTEAVAYVFARSTLLATLLCLASWQAWLHKRHWQAVAWFAAALLSKEECVFFPAFLAVSDSGQRQGEDHAERLPIAAMLLLSFIAGFRVLVATRLVPAAGAGFSSVVSAPEYALAQGAVIWRYLGLLIFPAGLTFDADLHPPAWAGLAGWAVLAAFAALGFRKRLRYPEGLWFAGGVVLLLASSSVFPADDLTADRRMYLPMISFSAAAGMTLARFPRWVPVVALLALVPVTVIRTAVWQSELTLWKDAVAKAPRKVRPRIQLSRALGPDAALEQLAEAARLSPGDPRVASEQGRVHVHMRRPELAVADFGRAAALDPSSPVEWNNLGGAFAMLGQNAAAEREFRHALQLDPCFTGARRNLGLPPCGEKNRLEKKP